MRLEVNLDADRTEEFKCLKFSVASAESSFPEGTLCIWTDAEEAFSGPTYIFNKTAWESLEVIR